MDVRVIATGYTKKQRAAGKWGVSFLIEDVLFDTFGDEQTLLNNLGKMKISPQKIKYLAVSHDHWDHTAGLEKILKLNSKIKVFICAGSSRELKNKLVKNSAQIIEVKNKVKIKKNIFSSGQIQGTYDGKTIFEQSLVCKTKKGLVVITGCAHPGVMKILNYVRGNFREPLYALVGGFHLNQMPKEYIEELVTQIKSLGLKLSGPTHCTGNLATKIFKRVFTNGFIRIKQGCPYKF